VGEADLLGVVFERPVSYNAEADAKSCDAMQHFFKTLF